MLLPILILTTEGCSFYTRSCP